MTVIRTVEMNCSDMIAHYRFKKRNKDCDIKNHRAILEGRVSGGFCAFFMTIRDEKKSNIHYSNICENNKE